MQNQLFGVPGRIADTLVESAVIGSNLVRQGTAWFFNVNRIGILRFIRRRFPDCYKVLDGGDKRIVRAFLDPDSISNTFSLLGGKNGPADETELAFRTREVLHLLQDTSGSEADFDNSFVARQRGADSGSERWFFINGIATSRDVARLNVDVLSSMFKRPFTLIHNPTQGLTNDLVESALQKFTNINTEPVARAFFEIGHALLDDAVKDVVVLAHSQGTIITGDVLDLIYCSIDRKYFDRTNMDDEDFDTFLNQSAGTVKASELKAVAARLKEAGPKIVEKLQLYMFANAASRMCYLDEEQKSPHIESFANEHDIVTRLGSLARDVFHVEDLIRIDGSLFTCDRYGHLLNAHYLPDFRAGNYKRSAEAPETCIGMSVHDPVKGNPCQKHPKHLTGPKDSRLLALYHAAQQAPGAVAPIDARAWS